jgi:hypothetical protein
MIYKVLLALNEQGEKIMVAVAIIIDVAIALFI